MNTQPAKPLGSGKDLPCGWKDGKQSGFWKSSVEGSLNTFRDESMLGSKPDNPGTPGSASLTLPREIPLLHQTHLQPLQPESF